MAAAGQSRLPAPRARIPQFPQFPPRMKLLIFFGITLFGALGWHAGESFGILGAFLCSGLGSLFGVYAGWWLARRYLQ